MKEMLAKFQQVLERTQLNGGLRQPGVESSQAQALTPENLRQLQAQEAQRRESKTKGQKGVEAPPAPTASQPPFPFGDQRGHGTPKYGREGLKQEDLKLDPSKRRKKNPPGTAASTPVTNHDTPVTIASPQQTKAKKPEVLPYKCAATECEYHMKGFATKNELGVHTKEVHERVADPRAFFIESTRQGLGLDENGRAKKKMVESVPATPAAMARGVSQNGIKVGTPASNVSKAPQLGAGASVGNNALSAAKAETLVTDLWDDCPVTLLNLQDTFGDINMDGIMPYEGGADTGLDSMMELYMQSDAWTKTQPQINKLPSDDSSNKSPAENSEQDGLAAQVSNDSDTSKSGDEFFVDLTGVGNGDVKMDDSWELPDLPGLPAQDKPFDADEEWINIGDITFDETKMSDQSFEGEPWRDIDWEKELGAQ